MKQYILKRESVDIKYEIKSGIIIRKENYQKSIYWFDRKSKRKQCKTDNGHEKDNKQLILERVVKNKNVKCEY